MKYYIKKYYDGGETENTYWSDVKIEGLTPIKIEKVDTGQTKKVKVGTKQQYKQVDGSWSDEFNENSVVGTVNSRGKRFYKRAGENYTDRGNYGSVWRTVDVYEDQPVYRGRYLYKKDQVKPKPSTSVSSKPVQPSRPNIPDQYKEGLAEIKDGLTYYTFPKYTTEQVTQAIQELFGNDIPTQKQLYQDYTPDNKKSDTQQNATSNYQDSELPDQNAKPSNQKVEQAKTNVKDNKDSLIDKITNLFSFSESKNKIKPKEIVIQDPEFKEYYAYPYEVDQFYNISPEVYSQVLSRLESKYSDGEDKLKEYIFTEKPLAYYKPGETFRDTIYTFVNSGGVQHQPLIRSTLDYKKDKISEPFDITQSIHGARISDLNFGEYIPKIKDNKIKMPSGFSYYISSPYFYGDIPESTYKSDFENMDQSEKEKFKQYLKNTYPDVEWISSKDPRYLPEDYFYFKLTDSQKNKIDQIYNKNKQRHEKYNNELE